MSEGGNKLVRYREISDAMLEHGSKESMQGRTGDA